MQQKHHGWAHHFTASALIVSKRHLLLVHHKRIGAWVPPGGHIEAHEMPDQCVIREVLEETGLHVEIVSQPLPAAGDADAFFLPVPLYLQAVPAVENGQNYYHIDLAYHCRPTDANAIDEQGLPLVKHNDEINHCRWVPFAQATQLPLAKNVAEALLLLERLS